MALHKILVAFKRVPEPGTGMAVAGGEPERWTINPFDEVAIEAAVQLKEAGSADEVVAVSIGPRAVEEQARTAFARGVDRVLHIEEEAFLDSSTIATLLAAVIRQEQPELVIVGKQAVDDDNAQVGPMLAALLGWPQITGVTKIELHDDGNAVECDRMTDAGGERLAADLPAVLTSDLGLNEPRYVSLPALLRARRQRIDHTTPAELGVTPVSRVRTLSVAPTVRRRQHQRLATVEELISRLREHEKVL